MEHRIKVKDTFEAEKICKEFYTGGLLKVTSDGQNFLCMCSNHIAIVNVGEVLIKQTIPPNLVEYNNCDEDDIIDDPLLTFTLSNDDELLVSGHKSGLIKLWNWKNAELLKSWKGQHKGPLMKLAFNEKKTFVASGSIDSVRVWDIVNHSCNFKLGGVDGVTSILEFHKIGEDEILFVSGDEHVIRGWHLQKDGNHRQVYNLVGQYSRISSILITSDFQYLISVGFNPLAIVWDLKTKKEVRSIPISLNGPIGGSTLLPTCIELPGFEKPIIGNFVVFGAEKGKMVIYDFLKGAQVYIYDSELEPDVSDELRHRGLNGSEEKTHTIVNLIYNETTQLLIQVFSDQTILMYKLDCNFTCHKQVTGYLDEILDITYFGEDDDYVVVASNSSNLNVYDKNMNCILLKGHSDCIMSLATSPGFPNVLISGSKDHSVRVWMCKDGFFKCVASGTRHQAAIGAVALSHSCQDGKIISASEDQTLKVWKLPLLKYKQFMKLEVWRTVIAHDQAINSVCLSMRDDLIATGSQDKTAKIWSVSDLSLVGVFRGHIRAVWCVKFSPIDQVLLTSSADMTLRLWSISELRCLKTIEGHDCSVLNCAFFNNGTQIVSCGNDGLIKVWTIKNNECVTTLDKHASKVWAIAVSSDENRFVTGGTDSRLVFWRDTTEESKLKEIRVSEEKVEQEQHLSNLLQSDQLLEALQFAILLNRPFKVFKIIESISGKQTKQLETVVGQLSVDQKETIVKFVSEWNKNSKSSYIAQLVLSFLMPEIINNELKLSNETLEGLIAYTNRHYNRLATLLEDVQLVPYTAKLMEPHAG